MEFRDIDDDKSCISLTGWVVDDATVKTTMRVDVRGFTGANEVWFFRDAFAEFIRTLALFPMPLDSEARIESVNPGEAMLSIRPMDKARHLVAEARISRGHLLRENHYFYDRVSVAFELDPSLVPDIVRSLSTIIGEVEST